MLVISFHSLDWSNFHLALPYMIALGTPILLMAGICLWQAGKASASDLVYRDELTGIANRRAFLLRTKSLLRHAKPGDIGLLVLDVDGLKDINDRCGHQSGDELLAAAVARLKEANHYLFRIGGDEFAILIDHAAGERETIVLQLLEPFIVFFKTCGHDHRVAISHGYSSNQSRDSLESLFRRADASLGEFKRKRYAQGELLNRRAS
jgi:diguanylate cyclase (GGDEF)-like protein